MTRSKHLFDKAVISLVAGAGLLMAVGCSPEVQVPVHITRPAELNMAGRHTVVVDPVTGQGGDLITSRLKQALLDKNFTIVDRQSAIASIQAENSLTGTNTTQVKHASALIAGKVIRHTQDAHVETDAETDPQTNAKFTGFRTVAQASVEVSFDITDLQTTALLASKSELATAPVTTPFVPGEPPQVDFRPLYDQCCDQAVVQFMNQIAPHDEVINATLYKVKDSSQNDAGIAAFQAQNFKAAAAYFGGAISTAQTVPNFDTKDLSRLHSNCGWANECLFDYQQATNQYLQAQHINPAGVYGDSVRRCQQRVVDDQRLIDQSKS